jgi:hypothetical protein
LIKLFTKYSRWSKYRSERLNGCRALFDLARRVKASREMLFEGDRPVIVKPVLSIVRDPA